MKIVRGKDLEFVPASHENPEMPGVFKKVLATRDDLLAGRVQMINWASMPVGATFAAHYHEDMEEVFVIVSGSAEITISGVRNSLASGDVVVIPPRSLHEMKNCGSVPLEYIVVGITTDQGGKTVVP